MKFLSFNDLNETAKSGFLRIAFWSISLFAVSCIGGAVYGQSPNPNQIKPFKEIIPPSPEAAGLGKYGNVPVGLHTGIPQIEVPLYTIKSKVLEVPISLSYHASGIKVNEQASWVGLGWSLNAGGVITRSVLGLPDDNGGFLTTQVKNASQITQSDIDYVRGVANGQIDIESDYYFYNFTGHAGKFIFDDRKKIFLIPEAPLQIRHHPDGWFAITDEFGTIYKFAAFEFLSSGPAGSVMSPFKSSYFLSEMVSSDGSDTIKFNYAPDGVIFDNQVTFSETIGLKCNPNGQTSPTQTKSEGRIIREISSIKLMDITFSNGKVEFVKDLGRSDGLPSRLEKINIYSRELDKSFRLRKSIELGEGYFVSGSGFGQDSYRLKLTEIIEKDSHGGFIKRHSLTYNESVLLPHRSSLAQDWWGYYNGQLYNSSLIPLETVNFSGRPYIVGNGNREPNESAMKACMLTRIAYPTGGYTEFDFEPHYFSAMGKENRRVEANSGKLGNTTELLEQTVLFTPATAGWAKVSTTCSDIKDADPFYSRVTLRNQSESQYLLNHIYDPFHFSPFKERLEKEFLIYLTAGVTYELKARSKGNSNSPALDGAAFARAVIIFEETVPDLKKMAGGLRIKEIRDYESPHSAPLTKTYHYGLNESAKGVLLIPFEGLSTSKQEIESEFWWRDQTSPQMNGCYLICRSAKLLISGRAVHDLTALNGTSVVYPEVSVYERSLSMPNGKQVAQFQVREDGFMGTPNAYNNGRLQFNRSWEGGDEIWTGTYENNNKLIKVASSNYEILKSQEITGTKIGWKVDIYEGNCYPPIPDIGHFYFFDYPIYSGIKKLTQRNEVKYGTGDLKDFSITQEFKYDNLGEQHQQITRQTLISSEGDTLQTKYWYPADYDNIEFIPFLLQKNIVATPVKIEKFRNGKLIEGSITRLNEFGSPLEKFSFESNQTGLILNHQRNKIIPKGYVKKVEFSYDILTGNVQNIQQWDNTHTSFLWGYNHAFPIAEIVNAENKSASISLPGTAYGLVSYPFNYTSSKSVLLKVVRPGAIDFDIYFGSNPGPGASASFDYELEAPGSLLRRGTICNTCPKVSLSNIPAGNYTLKFTFNYNTATSLVYLIFAYPGLVPSNSGLIEFYHENFEDDASASMERAFTGLRCNFGRNFEVNFTLPNKRKYVISWREWNGSTWVLHQQDYTGHKIFTKNLYIDDVRIVPKDALMTTYTYDPLFGMTSSTDANNQTTYYEYDEFGRLALIKDDKGNVLKSYQYQYSGR